MEGHGRVTEIFLKARELSGPEREAFLHQACSGDDALAAEVRSLIERDADAAALLPTRSSEGTVTAPDAPTSEEIKQIDHYRIVRLIGIGGQGAVYEAYDEKIRRPVALKLLHAGLPENAKRRMRREAWIEGRLVHPNIVRVFDVGEYERRFYYSMELVEARPLSEVIRAFAKRGRDEELALDFGGRAHVEWAIQQIIVAARALHFAHLDGVVHRDVKPQNILLGKAPNPLKIADFGLAMELDGTRLTGTGQQLGTPFYMAPEQILALRDAIGPQTDVYALGVTLFHALTLQFPYRSESVQRYMSAIVRDAPRRARSLNRSVGRDLEVLIQKSLEKQPGDRFESAARLADELENVLHNRPIGERPPTSLERLRKWARRKPVHAVLAAVLTLGIPVLATVGAMYGQTVTAERQRLVEELAFKVENLRHGPDYTLERLIEAVSELLAIEPDHPLRLDRALAYRRLGSASGDAEQYARALADLEKVIDQHPDSAWPYLWKAFFLETMGRTDDAEEAIQRSADLQSDPPALEDLVYTAELAVEQEQFQRAVELCNMALQQQPGYARVLHTRATAFELLGSLDRALQDYREAHESDPESFKYAYNYATMLIDTGQLEEGEQTLNLVLDKYSDNSYVFESLSNLYLRRGQELLGEGRTQPAMRFFAQAEAYARHALKLGESSVWPRINLGASLMEQYRSGEPPEPSLPEEALQRYEDAARQLKEGRPFLGMNRVLSIALANWCDGLIQVRRAEAAMQVCEEVVSVAPEEPIGFYNLAGAYMLSGRHDDALRALRKNFELGDIEWEYLSHDDWFEPLRDDPRFLQLVDEMKGAAERSGD